MKEIPLTQGKFAIVDDEDFEYLNQFRWYAWTNGWNWYAVRNIHKSNGRQTQCSMHRFLLKPNAGMMSDHRNRNGLDNRRSNLRVCTNGENQANQKHQASTSRFKGVSWCKRTKKWRATITCNWKCLHLGFFEKEKDAADAYDRAALKNFGSFARLNNDKRKEAAVIALS